MDYPGLTRPVYPIPDNVKQALDDGQLWERYAARRAYQCNDYISWVTRARRMQTRRERLARMLEGLRTGAHTRAWITKQYIKSPDQSMVGAFAGKDIWKIYSIKQTLAAICDRAFR